LTKNHNYFIPIHLPSFIRRPPRDNGIPVFFDTRRFALVTPSARFHENDKPGPSFTAPPESPPNLPHLVHKYLYVYVDRITDKPAAPHTTRAKLLVHNSIMRPAVKETVAYALESPTAIGFDISGV
jgi:hypothetical protein